LNMFDIDEVVSALSAIDLGNHSSTSQSPSEQQEIQYSIIQRFDLSGAGNPVNVVLQIFDVLSTIFNESNEDFEKDSANIQKISDLLHLLATNRLISSSIAANKSATSLFKVFTDIKKKIQSSEMKQSSYNTVILNLFQLFENGWTFIESKQNIPIENFIFFSSIATECIDGDNIAAAESANSFLIKLLRCTMSTSLANKLFSHVVTNSEKFASTTSKDNAVKYLRYLALVSQFCGEGNDDQFILSRECGAVDALFRVCKGLPPSSNQVSAIFCVGYLLYILAFIPLTNNV